MTITNGYTTAAAFRAAIGDDTSLQTATIEAAIQTASRQVDGLCDRRFYLDGNASARTFCAEDWYCCQVDDFYTTSGLIVATGDGYTATYGTTWSASDYVTTPVNGVRGGLPWPYMELRAVANNIFPISYRVESVQVTAKWGWAAVPDAVAQATLLLAVSNYKAPEAPGGLLVDAMTGAVMRQRTDQRVLDLLGPYMRVSPIAVA